MFTPAVRRSVQKDEPEKPFWISFADMMTALMVLFLFVMSVALIAITHRVSDIDNKKKEQQDAIAQILDQIERSTRDYGVTIDRSRYVVDFRDRAHFSFDEYTITKLQARTLRAVAKSIIAVADQPIGSRWIKEILVEGYTDSTGAYLYNLNLSLDRSESVVCELLAPHQAGPTSLTTKELNDVRRLFVVGGYSANARKKTAAESRRIELQLQFLAPNESAVSHTDSGDVGKCALAGA
jgi:flagellar motor protein MotB